MLDKAYIGLKVFLLSLLMSVVSAAVCTAQVQEAGGSIYDGRIAVSRVSLCRSDSLVNLSLRVTYAPDMVKRGMVLYVSPQFIDASGHNLTLPPMMFGGRGRKAADADGRMHADVEFSGAYAPWLEGSSLCFVTEQLSGSFTLRDMRFRPTSLRKRMMRRSSPSTTLGWLSSRRARRRLTAPRLQTPWRYASSSTA